MYNWFDLRRSENEIYLVLKSRASFFFVLLIVSIFCVFLLFLFFFFCFTVTTFLCLFIPICRFLGRSDRSFVQELRHVFLNKCFQSFRTTLDAKRRTLGCLPRGSFPFCSRLRDRLTRPPSIFPIFHFLFILHI